MSRSESLERFSAGEPLEVHPDAVERELSRLWQQAGRTTGDLQPVTRACLWNVVFVLEHRTGLEGADSRPALERAVDALPSRVANRSLVLRTRPQTSNEASLSSFISTNCVLAEGGGKLVCSEEVTLVADEDGLNHLPGLVRALLAPGVPTAVVFGGLATPDNPVHQELVEIGDRIITLVDRTGHPDGLKTLKALFKERPLYGMDLGWIRQSTLRDEIAHRFEPPAGLQSDHVSAIHVRHPAHQKGSAKMLAGWLAASLGAKKAAQQTDGWQFALPNGRQLNLHLESGDHISVAFTAEAGPRTVVDTPDPEEPLEALLGDALTGRRHDTLLAQALDIGAIL